MEDKTEGLEPPFLGKIKSSNMENNPLVFLRKAPDKCFRRHFRKGLRSYLFEIITAEDLEIEEKGKIVQGIRQFPGAKPIKMVRILKKGFNCLNEALGEIEKYRILLKFLGPDLVAKSEEFIVNHRESGESIILLCGLQEYIEGSILDPWHLTGKNDLQHFYRPDSTLPCSDFILEASTSIKAFVKAVRTMISAKGYIPDLAGTGNLMLTKDGGLKLVDINNIIKIENSPGICLDDKGYPCCDKSVEVLSILEQRILNNPMDPDDPLYKRFFTPGRRKEVTILEEAFYQKL